jgi:hypothetical protein
MGQGNAERVAGERFRLLVASRLPSYSAVRHSFPPLERARSCKELEMFLLSEPGIDKTFREKERFASHDPQGDQWLGRVWSRMKVE